MYAIIRTGGHQEKVTVGETITVDHLKQDEGSEIRFTPLLVSADDGTVVTDHKELTEKATVVGHVVRHARGDKIDVFQYRQKTGYRRHIGHRSMLTLVEISEITLGDKKVTLDEARAAKEQSKKEADEARDAKMKARTEAKAKKAAESKAKKPAAAKKAAPAKRAGAGAKKAGAASKKAPAKPKPKKG